MKHGGFTGWNILHMVIEYVEEYDVCPCSSLRKKESCEYYGVKVPYFELPVQGRGYIAEITDRIYHPCVSNKRKRSWKPSGCHHYRMSRLRKTTSLRALEDIGFFCVDNCRLFFFRNFSRYNPPYQKMSQKSQMVMDLREKSFLESYTRYLSIWTRRATNWNSISGYQWWCPVASFQRNQANTPAFIAGSVMDGSTAKG